MSNNDLATRANRMVYDMMQKGEYAVGAPHLSHASIRHLYEKLVLRVFESASGQKKCPYILDLGAGDGTATLPFLQLGARVLAVDISERQMEQLRTKCAEFDDRLETRCEDMKKVLDNASRFDIVVMNSVLHHIPDYMSLIKRVSHILADDGVFMSFQDPMWKKTISKRDAIVSNFAYFVWRMGRGDILGGAWRRFRRALNIYSAESPHDNTEYHAVRNGVDQLGICKFFEQHGFVCKVIEYCSFHSAMLQPFGERLGVKNTFAIVAGRDASLFDSL